MKTSDDPQGEYEPFFMTMIHLDKCVENLKATCLSGDDGRMRDAWCTLMQVYIAYHPRPELPWLDLREDIYQAKAGAIQRTFDTENSVDGLSVQEAYRKRKRKSRKSGPKKKRRKSTNKHERVSIAEWLRDVCQQVDIFLDEVASTDTDDAANVLPAIDAAVEELNRLRSQVQQRISAQ